ncbi:MAG: hypothetical protein WA099_09995 [Sulfuricurvum sp.]
MSNGENSWGVSFSRIAWLENSIEQHGNVSSIIRHDDIVIEVDRNDGSHITVLCLDEYAMGEAAVLRAFKEFSEVNFISVGGNWNGYTPEAKELCLSRKVGLYNASELTGALWNDEFWKFHYKDDEGNPSYPYKQTRAS